jgi:hypothetical protein
MDIRYGVFDVRNGWMLEGGFKTMSDAAEEADRRLLDKRETDLIIARVCYFHLTQPAKSCLACSPSEH